MTLLSFTTAWSDEPIFIESSHVVAIFRFREATSIKTNAGGETATFPVSERVEEAVERVNKANNLKATNSLPL